MFARGNYNDFSAGQVNPIPQENGAGGGIQESSNNSGPLQIATSPKQISIEKKYFLREEIYALFQLRGTPGMFRDIFQIVPYPNRSG